MKNLFWIPALLIVFFVGDRLSGYLMNNITKESQFRYSKLYGKTAQADILLVGNSRGLGFYQPLIEKATGLKTFNISYNGMPIDLAKVLIADYLDKYPAPKKMLLEVTMTDRENTPLIIGFSPYSNFSERLNSLIKTKSKESYYANQLTHLYRYNNEIFQRVFYHFKKPDDNWLLDREISERMVNDARLQPTIDTKIEPYILDELVATIQHVQQKGVTVELVVNPYFPAFAAKMNGYENWKKQIESRTKLVIHDYATALSDKAYFGDFMHINKRGSEQLINLLVRDKVL
ncbi:MAG: hypothetical protein WAS72_01080 [Saprospiraceae bacterium]